jgi:DNA-binding transcriptional LysR family regulator
MLDSNALRSFIVVAQELHFGRSAEHLGIAQSALSRQIAALERGLGIRLLNRGRRSLVTLTAPGRALLADSLDVMKQLDRAERSVRCAARGEVGRVEIGYVVSAALCGVLTRSLEVSRQRHPEVDVGVNMMETPQQLAALRDHLLDVGFMRPRETYPAGVAAVVVHRESLLLAVAASHPLASRRVDLTALAKETFIIPQFDESAGFAEHLAALASSGGFEPRRVHRVRDFVTAIAMAAAGYGVVPAPRSMLSIALEKIVYRPIHGYDGTVELVMAFREKQLTPAARGFIDGVAHPRGRRPPAGALLHST